MTSSGAPDVPDGYKGPAALIVRHAERYPITDVFRALEVGLTERGKADAKAFGSLLRGFSTVRAFHSPALRCRQTSEGIVEGLRGNGTAVHLPVEVPGLCSPYIRDRRAVFREVERLGNDFPRAWYDGRFSGEMIMPAEEAVDLVLSPVLTRLAEPGGPHRLDVHVSHDWEVLLLREKLLGARYEKDGWIDFLEGMLFIPEGDGFRAIMNGRSTSFRYSGGRRAR